MKNLNPQFAPIPALLLILILNSAHLFATGTESTRALSIAGVSVVLADNQESVYANPAISARFERFAFSLPMRFTVTNDLVTIGELLAKNPRYAPAPEYTQPSAPVMGAQKILDSKTTQWYGISTGVSNGALHFHRFGLLFHNRYVTDYAENATLVTPTVVTRFSETREFALSYGHPLKRGIMVGANLKTKSTRDKTNLFTHDSVGYDQYLLGNLSTVPWEYQFGLDLGIQIPIKGARAIGASIRDIGYTTTGQRFPIVSMGFSQEFKKNLEEDKLVKGSALVCAELSDILNYDIVSSFRLGIEANYYILPNDRLNISVRGGLNSGGFSGGAGIRLLKLIHFEYATFVENQPTYAGQQKLRQHLITCGLSFDFNRIMPYSEFEIPR